MRKFNRRYFSTRPFIEKLFSIAQSPKENQIQTDTNQFIKNYFHPEKNSFRSNFLNDILKYWSIEQPTKNALWTFENKTQDCKTLTFNDIYTQSTNLANILRGNEFNLIPGNSVLVVLPNSAQERILLQLACHEIGLIFCPYDFKNFSEIEFRQRMKQLAIDCVITDDENVEIIRNLTYTPIRPLKCAIFTNSSELKVLPTGWININQSKNNNTTTTTKTVNDCNSNVPMIRFLSTKNQIVEYSQNEFYFKILLKSIWLNMKKSTNLIWMNNQNEINSFAPWLFGSSIFNKEINDFQTIRNTLEKYPIDSLYGSSTIYKTIEDQQELENKIHLKQLFSSETIEPKIQSQWHFLTNLYIRDNYFEFQKKSY